MVETRQRLESLWGLSPLQPNHNAPSLPPAKQQDLTGALHGVKMFTKMYLLKSYFQVPSHPDDNPNTAIITPFGTYTFAFSTFKPQKCGGHLPAPDGQHLWRSCCCYVDDILIFSISR
ncbi:uncharacterized protein [Palaemon carinicauda]|uniref:uncharacterized protein n=1 Tax=Palaemon carinicauda TaxID=392227 RepID=UPI0035B5915C